ncbi:GlxA family transcriptional regulator [Acidocella aminolytica]|jgi:transcriptional regulator GlxA family with amidase domain|uniref:Transcriptional regulator AraC n=1 Tax=Acidocella aminolytica 101 = DSM 11237 TaxID=1120923 RepID=A0A0D6PCR0_9PROT|nr:GlxA family transcriptional regulator [Acidocella aminolytica]GAN79560.1 transcriptional regulator AraC [Acidocella aminolytica 101 = DSM 11237]GBQ39233.1 AraC family transcriptional regulator [Acidocella aminolytica 101 = DSM 11237]SHF28168.1 Transcriptional regulator GlxA family, contains an amidase domain and an AraC-type DNA-binding HTH domain [Acidocella aminolytica 101 = DSM 11237]
MHRIGFFLYPGHQILDFAGPFGAFEAVARIAGRPLYELEALSQAGGLVRGSGGALVESRAAKEVALDTLIVVGGDITPMRAPGQVAAVRALAQETVRIASVCTGAFLLAEVGLLAGRRATTHWRVAHLLQREYPAVRVEADHIFIADRGVWTSAGITAGIDLALALIEADHGIEVARGVARELVVYHRRSGGQSQFSSLSEMEPATDRIRLALAFARDHLSEQLGVERLAEAAHLSPRQFSRAFRRETGETPARAVERLRVEAARLRLRDGAEPVEQIARGVGFTDPERMRRAFVKLHGVPPQAIRRAARKEVD